MVMLFNEELRCETINKRLRGLREEVGNNSTFLLEQSALLALSMVRINLLRLELLQGSDEDDQS